VYNEYIQDKHHIHMNSTKWVTLSEFIKYLGREGIVRVDENEKGFWITWVDTSPKALARQAEMQKRERADVDEEQRQRRQLKEQIERARLQAEALKGEGQGDLEKGLQRGEGEKVSLTLGGLRGVAGGSPDASTAETTNPSTSTSTEPTTVTPSTTTIITTPSTDPTPKLTSNPLKRASTSNVFKLSKSLKSSKSSTPSETETEKTHLSSKKFLTVAERVMLEDQERQKRKLSSGYQGMGPSRGGR
jgi:DNA/RNA-binding protein KIN17